MRRGVRAGVVVMLLLVAAPAQARKVANPTTALGATLTSYAVSIADGKYGWTGPTAFTFGKAGTVDGAGNVTIPAAALTFPDVPVPNISGDTSSPCGNAHYDITPATGNTSVLVSLIADGPATGAVDPLTGVATLTLSAHAKVAFHAKISTACGSTEWEPSNCRIGDASSPVTIPLSTEAPGGHRYSDADGSLTLGGNQFALPASQGCADGAAFGLGPYFEPGINNAIGLPSPAGHNTLALGGTLDPVLKRGVRASLTATPASGTAPLAVTLDGSGSTATAGVASYAFDVNGDGTDDVTGSASSTTATFSAPGTYTARLTVTDAEGDVDRTTQTVTVTAPPASDPGGGTTGGSAPAGGTPAGGETPGSGTVTNDASSLAALAFGRVVRLPRRCGRGRAVAFALVLPRGQRLRSVRAFVGRHRVRVRRAHGFFRVAGLPRRPFVLRIVVVTRAGHRIAGRHRYRGCG